MRISELIEILAAAIGEGGDIEIRFQTDAATPEDATDASAPVAGFLFIPQEVEGDIPGDYLLLCDAETMEARDESEL